MVQGDFAPTSFISFIASTMQTVLIPLDFIARLHEGRGVRRRREIERSDHRAVDGGHAGLELKTRVLAAARVGRCRSRCGWHGHGSGRGRRAILLQAHPAAVFFDLDFGEAGLFKYANQLFELFKVHGFSPFAPRTHAEPGRGLSEHPVGYARSR